MYSGISECVHSRNEWVCTHWGMSEYVHSGMSKCVHWGMSEWEYPGNAECGLPGMFLLVPRSAG